MCIRDRSHKVQVRHLIEVLLQKGFVYLGTFEGWYDDGQEEYYTVNPCINNWRANFRTTCPDPTPSLIRTLNVGDKGQRN